MWKQNMPGLGEHAQRFTNLLGTPKEPTNLVRAVLDVIGVVQLVQDDLLVMEDVPRGLLGLARLVHESVVAMVRLGLDGSQVDALLASVLDDELCRVDPDRGYLGVSGIPTVLRGRALDPPGFTPLDAGALLRKLQGMTP